MPCGSIVHVEPADSQYKQRQSEPKEAVSDVGYYGPASGSVAVENTEQVHATNEATGKDNGDNNSDDDLDDFFDSL